MQQEHYSVYRAILRAHGGEGRPKSFYFFWQLNCEKIIQFLEFCKDQGGKI